MIGMAKCIRDQGCQGPEAFEGAIFAFTLTVREQSLGSTIP